VKRHKVRTSDGYVLTVFRIPHGAAGGRGAAVRRPPVLLQHALLCSSEEWVSNPPEESLAYLLADAGFDVWLGNNRGGTWGQEHESLSADSDEFWDFTWDEMALSDLPAHIDYVLKTTGFPSLSYVGHSEGTIQAFAGFSRSAELSAKVNLFVALAPVAYVYHQTSPIYSIVADLKFAELIHFFGIRQLMPNGSILNKLAPKLCSLLPTGCNAAIFLFCGTTRHINATRLPVYLSETPAGTSVKNMEHWSQLARQNRFGMFDHGRRKNLAKYNQITPPSYDLSRMTVKTALFTGGHDILANPTDVRQLLAELPESTVVYHHHTADFAHLDFAWGKDANVSVYADVIERLRMHGGTAAHDVLLV